MFTVTAYYEPFITSPDVEVDEIKFATEATARSWCNAEVKWESCKRVVCEQLGIDMKGDFA